jgi:hypothetical protein
MLQYAIGDPSFISKYMLYTQNDKHRDVTPNDTHRGVTHNDKHRGVTFNDKHRDVTLNDKNQCVTRHSLDASGIRQVDTSGPYHVVYSIRNCCSRKWKIN